MGGTKYHSRNSDIEAAIRSCLKPNENYKPDNNVPVIESYVGSLKVALGALGFEALSAFATSSSNATVSGIAFLTMIGSATLGLYFAKKSSENFSD